MATEETDIRINVVPDRIIYIGTLKVVGTKERVKLGGVPVIQPGFEFTVEIIDERNEGIAAFQQRYPNVHSEIVIDLMRREPSS